RIHAEKIDGQASGGTVIDKSTVQKEGVRRTGIAVKGTADVGGGQPGGDGGMQGERDDEGAGVLIKADHAVVIRRAEGTHKLADGGAEVVRLHARSRVLYDVGRCRRCEKRCRDETQ